MHGPGAPRGPTSGKSGEEGSALGAGSFLSRISFALPRLCRGTEGQIRLLSGRSVSKKPGKCSRAACEYGALVA